MADAGRADDLLALTSLCPPSIDSPAFIIGQPESTDLEIPDEHRELVRAYGVGCFDEFLWIFATGAKNENLDVGSRTAVTGEILRNKKIPALREALAEFHRAPEELIQWGATDNGDSFLWVPVGDLADWPTVILQAGQLNFSISPRSSTGLILDLLSGVICIKFFPDDFPSPRPEFSPNPYA